MTNIFVVVRIDADFYHVNISVTQNLLTLSLGGRMNQKEVWNEHLKAGCCRLDLLVRWTQKSHCAQQTLRLIAPDAKTNEIVCEMNVKKSTKRFQWKIQCVSKSDLYKTHTQVTTQNALKTPCLAKHHGEAYNDFRLFSSLLRSFFFGLRKI